MKNKSFYLCLLLLLPVVSHAIDFTGRLSVLAYSNEDQTLTANQQSGRLMLDQSSDESEWSIHTKIARQSLHGIVFNDKHASQLFRYKNLSHNWLEENEITSSTRIGYDIDRAVYKKRIKNLTLSFGRQAIAWGSGRLWQPLNIYGAFTPTDLDTDYKPGIDSARADWFPSNFSSLTAVYAFSPSDNTSIEQHNNAALYYKSQVGNESEYALLIGNIIGHNVVGASFESLWNNIGWRVESAYYKEPNTNDAFHFSIAGFDYQFDNGVLLTGEWYHNSRGANQPIEFSNYQTDTFTLYGLQQHLSKNIVGLSFSKDISPLLNSGYTLLASNASLLHQLNFRYSLSDESDLLFSLQTALGEGLNVLYKQQSEFGHIPTSLSFRLRYYF